jgi:hypothetical protein
MLAEYRRENSLSLLPIILSLVRDVAPRAKLSLGTIDSLVEHDRKVRQCGS